MDHPMPSAVPGKPTEAVRELLAAVLEALTLPHDTPDYDARILRRAGLARVVAGEALAESPSNLGWNTDYLRSKLAAEQAEAEQREKNKCGRCRTPFDPSDMAFDGRARHRETPWCRRCVASCHESTDAFHACPICDPSRRSGDDR
ncbi:hypothetical protein ABZ281_29325 [Streptomyces sp. NPDC006265]|uniref:hypothetical protein n=1 Tax=Streptomyces sp. NPDC006265 TaxID=3156740 RepID=UPI0033AD59BA